MTHAAIPATSTRCFTTKSSRAVEINGGQRSERTHSVLPSSIQYARRRSASRDQQSLSLFDHRKCQRADTLLTRFPTHRLADTLRAGPYRAPNIRASVPSQPQGFIAERRVDGFVSKHDASMRARVSRENPVRTRASINALTCETTGRPAAYTRACRQHDSPERPN
jgi:hypothetical protein